MQHRDTAYLVPRLKDSRCPQFTDLMLDDI